LKKIVIASIGMTIGDWYYNKDSTHAKNERLYGSTYTEKKLYQLQFNVHLSSKKIIV
jgi:hypothetical protein